MKRKSKSIARRPRSRSLGQLLRRSAKTLSANLESAAQSLQQLPDQLADALEIKHLPDYLTHPDPEAGASLELSGYSQMHSYTCGAVAGWMVVKAIWPGRSAQKFYQTIAPDPELGTPTRTLVRALKQARVGVERTTPTFQHIVQAIDAGFPIIACIDRPGTDYSHWIVIYGYDRESKTVYLAGNRWEWQRGLQPNVLPYAEFRSLCLGKLLVCFGQA